MLIREAMYVDGMAKIVPNILLLSCSTVLMFLIGAYIYHYRLQHAVGLTNSTSTICVNGKCTTTMCIDNEPCRTVTSNSITVLPDGSRNSDNNDTILSPAPLRSA
jgi:hypothetical protein